MPLVPIGGRRGNLRSRLARVVTQKPCLKKIKFWTWREYSDRVLA